jgi:hypothetical protein
LSGYFQFPKGATEHPERADTWLLMTDLLKDILPLPGLYTLRTWSEYGFKQVKPELAWADFRLTDYSLLQRCWEIVRECLFVSDASCRALPG